MLQRFLLIPLAICAGLIFPLLQKLVSGIPLNCAEWTGFGVIVVIIVGLILWVILLDKEVKDKEEQRHQELLDAIRNINK